MSVVRKKIGLVLGTVPNTDEIDQFKLLQEKYKSIYRIGIRTIMYSLQKVFE